NTRKIRRRRKKLKQKQSKKNKGHDIFLPRRDGDKLRVCRLFFINTRSLREDTFKRWVKGDKEDGFTSSDGSERNSNDEDNQQPPAKISRCQSKIKGIKQKLHNKMTENVLEWLELQPKVPSHYCRSSSSCTYVKSVFRSISHMRKVYEELCGQKEVKAASRTFFMQVLENKRIKIHKPRKDQCDVCCGYEVKTITAEEYNKRIVMKNEAKEAKNEATSDASESHLVISMYLQSVLLSPKTEASTTMMDVPFHIHSLRPGKKTDDLVVTDTSALEYRNSGEILFKLRHTDTFQFLPQRQQKRTGHVVPELLYSQPIPIAESKWKCLQELKNVIAKDYHAFYDNLPFQKDNKTTKGKK
ncbi:hypothetical protein ILUMI_01219, partial [Ignelater luminosus]